MSTPKTELPMGSPSVGLPRRGGLKRLVVGCLTAAGVTLAIGAMSPAMADDDWNGNWKKGGWHHDNGWHNGHHKHKKHRRHYNGYYQGGYYYYSPPVYYAPPPVYYAPPPVVYYPRRPSVSIIFPLDFD